MPIFPEVGWMFQNQPELSEQAQRALDLKGQLPLSQLDPSLGLSIQVDDWDKPEYLWLRRNLSTSYRLSAVAGAGFPSVAQLVLGGTRPYIAVIEKILLSNTTAAAIQYEIYLAATGVAPFTLGGAARDDRMRPNLASAQGAGGLLAGIINTVAKPTLPAAGALVVTSPANSMIVLEVPFIITGLSFFTVATVANNTPLEVSVIARERPGVTSEG